MELCSLSPVFGGRCEGEADDMLGVTLLALAVAGQSLGPPGSATRSADVAAVLETLLRAVAAEHCGSKVCYVTVGGKAPGLRVLDRLALVPHVRGMPATGLPTDERSGARVIDLSPVRFESRDRARADASVDDDWSGTGTLVTSESCRYHFVRGASGWELRAKETMCVVM
jgi:hypothetical protein